jgi:8-oxo-dGTP diphosphatase
MMLVRAAGGLVLRRVGDDDEVLMVHRPAYDDWSFPKGKLESGEDDLAAALREVEEEAGVRAEPNEDLGAIRYVDGRGRPKTVRYWTMSVPSDDEPAPGNEVDIAVWVPVDDALRRLTYRHDRELLARVTATNVSARRVPIYVVRHAKAGDRGGWSGPDQLRGLSKSGRLQAERLVTLFDGVAIEHLFSSPFVRCIQTLDPLAENRGLDIRLARELEEGADVEAVEALILAAASDGPAALSTHGDVVTELIERLLAQGVSLRDSEEFGFRKASVWVLDVVDGDVESASYLPPPDEAVSSRPDRA